MSVEYYVVKVVHYGGTRYMDVPEDKVASDGSIDVDWVRCNFPHAEMEVADEDIMDERLGGM